MAKSKLEKLARRRELRTKQRTQEREDMFVCDYIKYKYPTIHEEAAQVFRLLINRYPNKLDIRKVEEHKIWKMYDMPRMHPVYNLHQTTVISSDGTMNMHSAYNIHQTTTIPPEAQLRVIFPQPSTTETASPQPSTTETASPQPSTTETASPQPSTTETASPQPSTTETASPQPSTTETASPQPSTTETASPQPFTTETASPQPFTTETASPQPFTTETASPQPFTTETASPDPLNPKPPNPPKPVGKIAYKDNMQLIIPLFKSPVNHPGVVTETLEIITEETLQGNEHLPNLDEIDSKIIDQLISELRTDPDLRSIFTDLEQLECEEVAIDINMDTRLEDELENWEFW